MDETVYYRYLYFQENGRVLHALSYAPPRQMFKRLLKVFLKHEESPPAALGAFQAKKNALTVVARQSWHTVKSQLSIEGDQMNGRFETLVLKSHHSSPSGCFNEWSNDLVEYDVPDGCFWFVKNRR